MNSITGSAGTTADFSMVNRTTGQNSNRAKGATLDERTTTLIKNRDQNGDGVLGADELNISADAFSKLDANNNGTVDRTELNKAYVATHPLGQNNQGTQGAILDQRTTDLIKSRDQSGDGLLSAQELNISADAFSKIDANNSGTADRTELNTAYVANHAADQYLKSANASTINAAVNSASSYSPVNVKV